MPPFTHPFLTLVDALDGYDLRQQEGRVGATSRSRLVQAGRVVKLENHLAGLVESTLVLHTKPGTPQPVVHPHAAEEGGAVVVCVGVGKEEYGMKLTGGSWVVCVGGGVGR